MYAAISRCEDARPADQTAAPALERAQGTIGLTLVSGGGRTRLHRAFQQGSLKVRFPRVYDCDVPEAVVINTAGGITGGDRFSVCADVERGAAVTLTSQATERVYRSAGGEGRYDVALSVAEGARLDWLPHETILFDGGRISRTLRVDMAADASVTLCEAVILGRQARGESVRRGSIRDDWRVRRNGRLIYADAMRLQGNDAAAMGGTAALGGHRAYASLVVVAPDAESRVDAARAALEGAAANAGASAWDGMLAARLVAASGQALRAALTRLVSAIGIRAPRSWSI